MLVLRLSALPGTLRGPDDPAYGGRMPKRALFMAPDAAAALLALERDTGGLTYTDIFRSAESSLAAMRSKRGVQPPGYSGHGFGVSVDVDVRASLRRLGASARYPDLLDAMGRHGFHCHRRDMDGSGHESWHFNHLGTAAPRLLALADAENAATWSRCVEARIVEAYGEAFKLSHAGIQRALARLRLYDGEIDGILGPLSREAISAFQRGWNLVVSPDVSAPRFQRTLAYVAAEREIVALPGETPNA